jgi:hypothetical protein
MNQMNYIVKAKAETEEKLINGTTLLRKSLIEYNELLEFTKEMKEAFFDVYFKVKLNSPAGQLPIDDDMLREFRTVDEMSKKSLIKEIGDVGETKLLIENLHDKKKTKN